MLPLSGLLEQEAASLRTTGDRLGSGNPTLVNWFEPDLKTGGRSQSH